MARQGARTESPQRRPDPYAGHVRTADELTRELRQRGYRVTRPRQAVWRVLSDAHGHLTAEQVAARVSQHEPGVNLASVYRSLALFASLNLVRESRLGDNDVVRWEVAHPDEHFHLVCETCGRVDHHTGDLVARVIEHLQTGHDFEASSVELTVAGRCATCARRSDESAM